MTHILFSADLRARSLPQIKPIWLAYQWSHIKRLIRLHTIIVSCQSWYQWTFPHFNTNFSSQVLFFDPERGMVESTQVFKSNSYYIWIICNNHKNFRCRRWGPSLPALHTLDPPLRPPSTLVGIFTPNIIFLCEIRKPTITLSGRKVCAGEEQRTKKEKKTSLIVDT